MGAGGWIAGKVLSQNGYNPSDWFNANGCPGTGESAGWTVGTGEGSIILATKFAKRAQKDAGSSEPTINFSGASC